MMMCQQLMRRGERRRTGADEAGAWFGRSLRGMGRSVWVVAWAAALARLAQRHRHRLQRQALRCPPS
jgi:hypothetical protein